jgi:hypothetical protein
LIFGGYHAEDIQTPGDYVVYTVNVDGNGLTETKLKLHVDNMAQADFRFPPPTNWQSAVLSHPALFANR